MSTPETLNAANKQRRGLGRGLGSLLGGDEVVIEKIHQPTPPAPSQRQPEAQEESLKKERLFSLGIERLAPNPKQPRRVFHKVALETLAASIKEKGILQPVVVRKSGKDSFEIVAGERRWRAAQLAGLSEVPVILKEVGEQETLELALIENIQREELNAIEEAEAYQRLASDFLLTQQEIAKRVGKDRATIANMIRLLELPEEIRALVEGGQLSAGHAKALLGLSANDRRLAAAKEIVKKELSVRATEKLVQAEQKAQSTNLSAEVDELAVDVSRRLVERLSEELQKAFGTKVGIDYSGKKGKISIYFYSDEELSKLIEKLKNV